MKYLEEADGLHFSALLNSPVQQSSGLLVTAQALLQPTVAPSGPFTSCPAGHPSFIFAAQLVVAHGEFSGVILTGKLKPSTLLTS